MSLKPKQLRITLANQDTVTVPLAEGTFVWAISYSGALVVHNDDGGYERAYAAGTWLAAEVVP